MSKIYKISSPHCPICEMMSSYDKDVLSSLGFQLVEVHDEELESNKELWQLILNCYPGDTLGFPSYGSLETRNFIVGGSSKRDFRNKVISNFFEQVVVPGSGTEVPLRKENLVVHFLPIFSANGWELCSLEDLSFTEGRPIDPPVEIWRPLRQEGVEITQPSDLINLFT